MQPFFSARSHEPVWRTLRSAVQRGEGVVIVTGEPGIGKTQLLLRLQGVLPENRDMALVPDGGLPLASFTQILCKAAGARFAGPEAWSITPRELLGAIANRVGNGRKFLVAIDQAHHLSRENLAILETLVHFSIRRVRPVQILLMGRPELLQALESPAFQTLQASLIASTQITPLTRVEVWEYIRFKTLKALGRTRRMTWPAWLEIFAASRGNPQEIDLLLHRVLLLTHQRSARIMTGEQVRTCRMEMDPNYHPPPGKRLIPWVSLMPLVLLLGYLIGLLIPASSPPVPSEEVTPRPVLTHPQERHGHPVSTAPTPPPKPNIKKPASAPKKTAAAQPVSPPPVVMPTPPDDPQVTTETTRPDVEPVSSGMEKALSFVADVPAETEDADTTTQGESLSPHEKPPPRIPPRKKREAHPPPIPHAERPSADDMPDIMPVPRGSARGAPPDMPKPEKPANLRKTDRNTIPVPAPLKQTRPTTTKVLPPYTGPLKNTPLRATPLSENP